MNMLIYVVICHKKKAELFSSNPSTKKWSQVSVHLKANYVPHGSMRKVVELLLCLPGSNASIERVFSHMNYIWSEVSVSYGHNTSHFSSENGY
jgi:hypothetical protein